MPGAHRGADIPVDHPLVAAFATPAAVEHSRGGPSRAGTMVCDAKIVSCGGWAPSVVLGPIGEGLHSQDERVDIESVAACVVRLALGASRYFGTDAS